MIIFSVKKKKILRQNLLIPELLIFASYITCFILILRKFPSFFIAQNLQPIAYGLYFAEKTFMTCSDSSN